MFNSVQELVNAGYVRFEEGVKECAMVDSVCNETVIDHYAAAQRATDRFVQGLYVNTDSCSYVIEAGILDRVFIEVTKEYIDDGTPDGQFVFKVVGH